MVRCDRCHHKFDTYTALAHHYRNVHSNVKVPDYLEKRLLEERQIDAAHVKLGSSSSSRIKLVAFVLVVVIMVGVIGFVAFSTNGGAVNPVNVGSTAPDFTLSDTYGGTFTLSQFKGQSNVLLLFTDGLSCQPCLQEIHDLDQVNAQLTGMNVIVISIVPDRIADLGSWVQSGGPLYGHVLADPGFTAIDLYHPRGNAGSMMTNTFVLVNESGAIVWRHDYGPNTLYVPGGDVVAAVSKALGGS